MKAFGSDKKTTNVIMIGVATVAGVVLMWQFVIVNLQLGLQSKKSELNILRDEVERANTTATLLGEFTSDYELGLERLKAEENSSVTQGDPYRWIINRLRELQEKHNVSITDFERPTVAEWVSLPKPEGYQQASFTVRGTSFFHDFGSFLSSVENTLPFARIKSLALKTSTGSYSIVAGNEKLVFEIQFINPYKAASN